MPPKNKKSSKKPITLPKGARVSDVAPHLYVKKSKVHGRGLFTARKIKKGTVIGELIGTPALENDTYVLWLNDEIGLKLITDLRYINHDDDPNVEVTWDEVIALRNIAPDEELFFDYQW